MDEKTLETPRLHLSGAPHVRSRMSVPMIMGAVLIALVPSFVASVVFFGTSAVLLTLVCIAAAVAAEFFANLIMKRPQTIGDCSAVITGVLVAFNVSPSLPLWMGALGSVFAIIVAKMVFGGLGCNFINPALAGRVFLIASYPAPMTSFPATNFGSINGLDAKSLTGALNEWSILPPDAAASASLSAAVDAVTSATPLEAIKSTSILDSYAANITEFHKALTDLFVGNVGGCLGETSAVALLAGGIFLMAIRAIDFRIPFFYILTVFGLFWLTNGTSTYFTVDALITPTFHILAGGLFLGAFFMATDPVTSPITPNGRIIFGVGCGLLTFVIRKYGGYPEGVSFSIVLMNLVVPLIDRCTRPAIYGEVKKRA
ncbi:MAG: RnfABCDGE type electron transport complex subunit D [Chitinispirillia bacterium]|nr:RnfABCDGE type electron transport complex subunit D [Chitinispirillia bacterium]MCL2242185.1 RnfABCDGE type electron transport complex subunit D [Chitinispirillia bacterium]